jgi:hypothetical protein
MLAEMVFDNRRICRIVVLGLSLAAMRCAPAGSENTHVRRVVTAVSAALSLVT